MYNNLSCTLNRINTGKKTRLKILTTATHEGFQTNLARTGHEFYLLMGQGFKTWDYHTKPLPPNHYILNKPFPPMPAGLDFDLLLSQDRNGGLQRMLEIKRFTGVPIVNINHTMPPPGMPERGVKTLFSLRADAECFITAFSREAWGAYPVNDPVIYHGIDPEVYKGWNGLENSHGVSVVNHFAQRDVFCGWSNWQQVAQEIPMRLVGENPGLSESAKSTEDLVQQLASARFFLNTSTYSPIPLSLVEAMMVGCPIVSTNHQEIKKFLKHEENALIANSPEEMVGSAKRLMRDSKLCVALGQAARETALKHFHMDRFCKEWNDIFLETYRKST